MFLFLYCISPNFSENLQNSPCLKKKNPSHFTATASDIESVGFNQDSGDNNLLQPNTQNAKMDTNVKISLHWVPLTTSSVTTSTRL